MDPVVEKIINNSKLSDIIKNQTINLFSEYLDEIYGYLSVGDIGELIDKLTLLEKDLKRFEDPETIKAFIYTLSKKYCKREKSDNRVPVWKQHYQTLIKNTLLDDFNRKYFLTIENPNTAIVEFICKAAKLVDEFLDLIKKEQSFLVLKKYQELIEFCNRDGIDAELLNEGREEELKRAINKRYSIYSAITPMSYKKAVKQRLLSKEEAIYQPDNYVYFLSESYEASMLQELLHPIIKEYYKKTGFIVRPYTRDINIYYLKDINIVAYRYDNVPKICLKSGRLTLTYKDRDFWTKIFNPNIDYVEGASVNYFIDTEEKKEFYSVKSLLFDSISFKKFNGKVIYAPEKHIEEAIYKSLTENDNFPLETAFRKKLETYGLNFENKNNKLLTSDYSFFFKDPAKVDDLEIDNLEDYQYLNMIKSKTNPKSRKQCITTLTTLSKKDPKKPDPLPKKPKNYNYYKKTINKINLPYKDN